MVTMPIIAAPRVAKGQKNSFFLIKYAMNFCNRLVTLIVPLILLSYYLPN